MQRDEQLLIQKTIDMQDEELREAIVAKHKQEAIALEQNAAALKDAANDVAKLVVTQGPMINAINAEVAKAENNFDSFLRSLAATAEHKRRSRILWSIVGAIVVVGIGAGVGYALKGSVGLGGGFSALAGAGIVLGGIILVGLIGYGIYRFYQSYKTLREEAARVLTLNHTLDNTRVFSLANTKDIAINLKAELSGGTATTTLEAAPVAGKKPNSLFPKPQASSAPADEKQQSPPVVTPVIKR